MDPVEAAEQRIRDIVNSPRHRYALLQDRQRWFRLCSAMDAIGDTQMAVRAYLDEPIDDSESKGWSYLVVYGILQVLYVQQDAAKTIAHSLKLPFALPVELETIRELRNDAIGHPAGRGAFISRISLSAEGFQLRVPGKNGIRELQHVGLRAIVEQQTTVMGALLEQAVEQLVTDELAHRKQFRDRLLRDALPENKLDYATEKIAGGLRDLSERPMAFGGIDVVRAAVAEFRRRIDERGLSLAYEDTVIETILEVEHAVNRVESQLKGIALGWTERDADVYWFFLSEKLRELTKLAAEIDGDYESDQVL